MTQEKNKEALQKIKTIHPDLRRAIASSANADKIFDIGKNYNLQVDKIGELASETMYLMLGITHPNDFVGNLAERLQIDRASASKIADDINREIFAPVREHLRSLFGITPTTNEKPISSAPQAQKSIPRTPLSAIGHQPVASNNTFQPSTSLEDLEAELERALAEEKGVQPLSVVKKSVLAPKPPVEPQSSYKGMDPYREQVGEDLPNVRGKAYTPQNMEQKKEEFSAKGGSAFGGQVSRKQSTPTPKPVEENSVFSPLGGQKQPNNPIQEKTANPASETDKYREPVKQSDTLSPFRGFKMNEGAEKKEEDPYKESIM